VHALRLGLQRPRLRGRAAAAAACAQRSARLRRARQAAGHGG